ncbi:MAG: hypothetical protein ACE362_16215 [Phaeodactylibacter xiamenensis]|uniref:hypothetical protein n=1 Tax=Phaeodactylibacter xiamenensis TaxID=1524460 RepID=UPI0005C649DD|nr:hypothetical protein [Phaeodactylibacter xiamenensis]
MVFWFSGAALAKAKDETLRGPPPEATASCRPQEDQASPLNLNLGQAPVQDQPQPYSALAKAKVDPAQRPGQAKDATLRDPPPEATASCRPQEDQASPLNLNLGQAPVQDQPQPASAQAKAKVDPAQRPGQAKDEPLRGPPPEATASCRPQEDQASPLNLNLNLGQAPVQDQPQPASALAKPLQSSNALDKSLISYFES